MTKSMLNACRQITALKNSAWKLKVTSPVEKHLIWKSTSSWWRTGGKNSTQIRQELLISKNLKLALFSAYTPMENHNVTENSRVLVYFHPKRGLIGIKLRIVRCVYDINKKPGEGPKKNAPNHPARRSEFCEKILSEWSPPSGYAFLRPAPWLDRCSGTQFVESRSDKTTSKSGAMFRYSSHF